jgi:hypothetical protein
LPGALFLCWFNQTLYGSAFKTGYGPIWALFSARYVPHNAAHFLLWLTLLSSPPVMLGALALPRLRARVPLFVPLAVIWSATFVGFYLFYFYSGEVWWYLRFILPMFPAVILAGVLGVYHARERFAGRRRWIPVALLAFALVWDYGLGRHLNVGWLKNTDMGYPLTAQWAKTNVPPNAILLEMQLSGAFAYYTDFAIVRWDLLDPKSTWPLLQDAARSARRPIYAALYDYEVARAWPDHGPGQWQLVQRIRQMSVWKLSDSASPAP